MFEIKLAMHKTNSLSSLTLAKIHDVLLRNLDVNSMETAAILLFKSNFSAFTILCERLGVIYFGDNKKINIHYFKDPEKITEIKTMFAKIYDLKIYDIRIPLESIKRVNLEKICANYSNAGVAKILGINLRHRENFCSYLTYLLNRPTDENLVSTTTTEDGSQNRFTVMSAPSLFNLQPSQDAPFSYPETTLAETASVGESEFSTPTILTTSTTSSIATSSSIESSEPAKLTLTLLRNYHILYSVTMEDLYQRIINSLTLKQMGTAMNCSQDVLRQFFSRLSFYYYGDFTSITKDVSLTQNANFYTAFTALRNEKVSDLVFQLDNYPRKLLDEYISQGLEIPPDDYWTRLRVLLREHQLTGIAYHLGINEKDLASALVKLGVVTGDEVDVSSFLMQKSGNKRFYERHRNSPTFFHATYVSQPSIPETMTTAQTSIELPATSFEPTSNPLPLALYDSTLTLTMPDDLSHDFLEEDEFFASLNQELNPETTFFPTETSSHALQEINDDVNFSEFYAEIVGEKRKPQDEPEDHIVQTKRTCL